MAYIRAQDRIGTIVNGFKILDVKRENNRTFAYVICPYCKQQIWKRLEHIVSGKNISCGCYNAENNFIKPKDISGMRFGRLKAIRPTNKRDKDNGSVIWECECECKNIVEIPGYRLIKGEVCSCGCLQAEVRSKNGHKAGKNIVDNYCINGTNVNNLTAKIPKNNTSGIKGVTFIKSRQKWGAQIVFKGKVYHLGTYSIKEDAEKARRLAEENKFGNFLKWYAAEYPDRWEQMQEKSSKLLTDQSGKE